MGVLSLPDKCLVQRGGGHGGSVLVASMGIKLESRIQTWPVSIFAHRHSGTQLCGGSAAERSAQVAFSRGVLMASSKQQAKMLIMALTGRTGVTTYLFHPVICRFYRSLNPADLQHVVFLSSSMLWKRHCSQNLN